MKKLLSLFCIAILIFSFVVGCSQANDEGDYDSKSGALEDTSNKTNEPTCCYQESDGTFCQETVSSQTNYCKKHQSVIDAEMEKYKKASEIINSGEFEKITKAIDEMEEQQQQKMIEEFNEMQGQN